MTWKFRWLMGALALCLWASPPSTAQADDDDWEDSRKHYSHGHHVHNRHGHDYGYGYRYRGRHGARKYVYDDGYCRTSYKRKKHGYKYTVRCRDRHDRGHRQTYYDRHDTGYGYGSDTIVFEPRFVAQTLDNAADGETIVWEDARGQGQFKIEPIQSYRTRKDGRYCREYLSTATIGGRTREVYGKACRQEDGSWELVR